MACFELGKGRNLDTNYVRKDAERAESVSPANVWSMTFDSPKRIWLPAAEWHKLRVGATQAVMSGFYGVGMGSSYRHSAVSTLASVFFRGALRG